MFKMISRVLEWLSGGWLLTRCRLANGSTVVFLRACLIAIIVCAIVLLVSNLLDPTPSEGFGIMELRMQLGAGKTVFGALFGAAFAALFARFASQWAHLAGTFNQIKAAQSRVDCSPQVIAEWQAAFIESCDDLHLVRSPQFASAVDAMLNSTEADALRVQGLFDARVPGGRSRRERIAREARGAVVNYPGEG